MTLAKHQRFEMRRMTRADLKACPYNPRSIDRHARKKLEACIKKRGLLEPLVFNKRSGTIISGHQRLACLDAVEGSDQYELDVSVVDLSPKDEREQIVMFNNQSAMGMWDVDLLGDLLKTPGLDIEGTGFDRIDLETMFTDDVLAPLFALEAAAPAVQEEVQNIAQAQAEKAAEIEAIKKRKKDYRAEAERTDNANFYAVVVFLDEAEQTKFMERVGCDPNANVEGAKLMTMLEPSLPEPPTA